MTAEITLVGVGVGVGSTAACTLDALVGPAMCPLAVTIFEQEPSAGRGTPYRPGWNDPAMLLNIASIEILPVEESSSTGCTRSRSEDEQRLTLNGTSLTNGLSIPGSRWVTFPRAVQGDHRAWRAFALDEVAGT